MFAMINSIVICPFTPISSIFSSHRGAQGVIYGDMIHHRGEENVVIDLGAKMSDDFNEFDRLYVYNGNDWGGSLNLYGGINMFPYSKNVMNFSNYRGEVISLSHEMPNYHELLGKKMRSTAAKNISEYFQKVDFDNLLSIQKRSKTVKHPYVTERVSVGDSHGISMYRPGWTINSVPYKTLYGVLNEGLIKHVMDPYINTSMLPTEVELYFGNIDIRHHVCRQEDPLASARELAKRYVAAALELKSELPSVKSVTICELLPIEDESRVIPNTGLYKGKGFWGSWYERNSARMTFNDGCEREAAIAGIGFKRWTSYLLNEKGQLDFSHMEYKRSVHLSRMSYPHWQGEAWNKAYLEKTSKKTFSIEDFFDND